MLLSTADERDPMVPGMGGWVFTQKSTFDIRASKTK